MVDITPLLESVIVAAVLAISIFVVPWLKSKIGVQNMGQFLAWVDIAVRAAEQIYSMADGAKKKHYVVNYLAARGFSVDAEDLDLAIEAAVNKLHYELYGATTAEAAK